MDPVLLDFGRRNVFCNKMGIGGKYRHWQRFGRIPNAFPNRSNGNMGLACVGSGFQMQDKEKGFAFLGRHSLYIYLTHTYIFMWCVNHLEWDTVWRFLISALATVVISVLCSALIHIPGIFTSGKLILRK